MHLILSILKFEIPRVPLRQKQKKQLLAQQPFLVRAFPFGISRQICFFYEAGLSD
jgi:hypothetical protein